MLKKPGLLEPGFFFFLRFLFFVERDYIKLLLSAKTQKGINIPPEAL